MEKRLGVKPSPASWVLPGYCWQTSVKLPRSLYLLYSFFCFSVLWLSTDADESRCQQGKTLYGAGLRTEGENHLRLLAGSLPFHACRAACCRDSACHALWWLEGMCFQADCSKPQSCQPFRTDSSNSMLIIFQKSQTTDDLGLLPEDDEPHLLRLGWGRTSWRRQSLLGAPLTLSVPSSHHQSLLRDRQKRDLSVVPTHGAMQHSKVNHSEEAGALSPTSAEVRKTITVAGSFTSNHTTQTPEWPKNVSIHPEPSEHSSPVSGTPQVKSTEHSPTDAPLPVAPSYSYATPTPQASSQSTSAPHPVVKELVVSAGKSVQITLPKNEVQLNAFVLPEAEPGETYTYDWQLITHPTDYSGEVERKHSQSLQLSKLTPGLYEFKVTVDGQNAHGEGYVNVTVKPEPRKNRPPVAVVSPQFQEISLPTTSTIIDGSQSTDDDKIVQYHWEELKGPLREEKISEDTAILKLSKLVPGNYTFSLTVVDSDGATNSTTASLTVNKAVDYPPVANAGPNQEEINKPPVAKIAGNVVVTLPTSTAELDGSRSSDDKGIVSYLWTRDETSPAAGEVLNHSDHHPVLFLSNLVEGTYTFHLKVTDAKGESDTDRTTVEVKPDPRKSNLVEIILDVNVSQLTERLKGMLIRQIGVLLGVLDSDIIVQKIQPYTEQSTKMLFFVQNDPPHQLFKGHEVAAMLKSELQKQKADFLIFRALEISTVTCQLNCSDHGHCDSFTKRCVCDPFWMENFIKVQLRDGDSNCEWSVLYVIIASFVIVVALGILSWTTICCCKRPPKCPHLRASLSAHTSLPESRHKQAHSLSSAVRAMQLGPEHP